MQMRKITKTNKTHKQMKPEISQNALLITKRDRKNSKGF